VILRAADTVNALGDGLPRLVVFAHDGAQNVRLSVDNGAYSASGTVLASRHHLARSIAADMGIVHGNRIQLDASFDQNGDYGPSLLVVGATITPAQEALLYAATGL